MTVLVSSHLLSEIDQMATEIGIIDHGELLFENSLHVLHAHSQESLHLRTSEPKRALALLKEKHVPASLSTSGPDRRDTILSLPMLSDSELSGVLHALITDHIEVFRIEESKKSLEDIFLDLTGRSVCLS